MTTIHLCNPSSRRQDPMSIFGQALLLAQRASTHYLERDGLPRDVVEEYVDRARLELSDYENNGDSNVRVQFACDNVTVIIDSDSNLLQLLTEWEIVNTLDENTLRRFRSETASLYVIGPEVDININGYAEDETMLKAAYDTNLALTALQSVRQSLIAETVYRQPPRWCLFRYTPTVTEDGQRIDMISSYHFDCLPEGTRLIHESGRTIVKGVDYVPSMGHFHTLSLGFPSKAPGDRAYYGRFRSE